MRDMDRTTKILLNIIAILFLVDAGAFMFRPDAAQYDYQIAQSLVERSYIYLQQMLSGEQDL
jgi:hypothetical protein